MKKTTKLSLVLSVFMMILSVSMLVSTTFAWFTDSASTGVNKIQAGNLNVKVEHSSDFASWEELSETKAIFDENALYEPGYTEVQYLKVTNDGSLALKYQVIVDVVSEVKGKNVNGEEFALSEALKYGVVEVTKEFASRGEALQAIEGVETNFASNVHHKEVKLMPAEEKAYAIVVYMPESVGNEANYREVKPEIQFGVKVDATQVVEEMDSFNNEYDKDAQNPVYVFDTKELKAALTNAKDGDVIDLGTNVMELSEGLSINKDITIQGGTIKNYSSYVSPDAQVVFKNVRFEETKAIANASSLYGSSFKGEMIFENCYFGNAGWESIQITPVANTTIKFNECVFEATSPMRRFIHVEVCDGRDYKVDVTITNCEFKGVELVNYGTSGINLLTVIDLDYFGEGSELTLGGCTFKNTDGTDMSDVINCYFCDEKAIQSITIAELREMLTGAIKTYTVE